MINLLGGTVGLSPEAIIGILGVLIGTGIGGLIVAMMEMFKSPAVPADTHERIVRCVAGPHPRRRPNSPAHSLPPGRWPLRMLRGGLFVV